jgi:acetyl-CoA synthetase
MLNSSFSETQLTLLTEYLELEPDIAWQQISKNLFTKKIPFAEQLYIFKKVFREWPDNLTAAAWTPQKDAILETQIWRFMQKRGFNNLKQLHDWSTQNFAEFWKAIIDELGIHFFIPPKQVCDLSHGIKNPIWLPSAKMNIAASCFQAPPAKTAIIYENSKQQLIYITYAELDNFSNQIAVSLEKLGLQSLDAIAICMPMNYEAVALYLGILKMGGIVVAIPESFSSKELALRLSIAHAKALFTQDFTIREDKQLPLYAKIINTDAPRTIVIPHESKTALCLRKEDLFWSEFLVSSVNYSMKAMNPSDSTNILFSSGTTGVPKAIPWNHTTGIKAASDAFFHQDVQSHDIVAWPTNLGWMMGPWLIFAGLINKATLALYTDSPRTRKFGEFIETTKVTLLGVVPALVATWRQSKCMEGLNWDKITRFSSTAECSNAEDMLYLMSLANYKPIIEYCGGTETGGGYISSTMIEKNCPAVFTTPVMGINFEILKTETDSVQGEVALIPPSIGLSVKLLNGEHDAIYYDNMPLSSAGQILRRHGDQIKQLPNGTYAMLGRIDDTMKLGGIKISSIEIERVLVGIPDIIETAAIAISPPQGGPSQLIIFTVTTKPIDKVYILKQMQTAISTHLNPLFKIHDVIFLKELPKTASNKIIRKQLRTLILSNSNC